MYIHDLLNDSKAESWHGGHFQIGQHQIERRDSTKFIVASPKLAVGHVVTLQSCSERIITYAVNKACDVSPKTRYAGTISFRLSHELYLKE